MTEGGGGDAIHRSYLRRKKLCIKSRLWMQMAATNVIRVHV